jgi:hypothetical protein
MPNNEGRTRARLAVAAELAHREWSTSRLARESGADPGTIGDFLGGKRWIKIPTQGKVERALGWRAGTIAAIESGQEPPQIGDSVGGDTEDPGIATIKARKPANMSDEDFKRLLNEYEEEIEWKLNRASREH